MSDNADWTAATWDLDPKVLDGLTRVLELLSQKAGGFSFRAVWIGDEVETRSHVPLSHVINDIQQNRVRNKHLYVVGDATQ